MNRTWTARLVLLVTCGMIAGALAATEPPGAVARAKAKECEVTCQSGHFACCLINGNGEPVCRCRLNGTSDEDCQGGGNGARHCKITTNTQGIYTSTTTLDDGTVYDLLIIDVGPMFLVIGDDSVEFIDKE